MISSAQDDKVQLSCPGFFFFSLKEKPAFTSGSHFLGMGFVICYAVKLPTDPLSNSCLEITTMTNCNSLQDSCQNPSGLFTLKLSVPKTDFVPRKTKKTKENFLVLQWRSMSGNGSCLDNIDAVNKRFLKFQLDLSFLRQQSSLERQEGIIPHVF